MILGGCILLAYFYSCRFGSWIQRSFCNQRQISQIIDTSRKHSRSASATLTPILSNLSTSSASLPISQTYWATPEVAMAKQPVKKLSKTQAAKKAAAKQRRKAGKEALRAMREKDIAAAAANSVKRQQEREGSLEIVKSLPQAKAPEQDTSIEDAKTITVEATNSTKTTATVLAMEQAEQEAYERVAQALLSNRTPSPDAPKEEEAAGKGHRDINTSCIAEDNDDDADQHAEMTDCVNKVHHEACHGNQDGETQNVPQVTTALQNIQIMTKKVAHALAIENAASEALTRRPLFAGNPIELAGGSGWAEDVEVANEASKATSGDEIEIDGSSPFAEAESERHSSPEVDFTMTSTDTSILSDDSLSVHDKRVAEAIEYGGEPGLYAVLGLETEANGEADKGNKITDTVQQSLAAGVSLIAQAPSHAPKNVQEHPEASLVFEDDDLYHNPQPRDVQIEMAPTVKVPDNETAVDLKDDGHVTNDKASTTATEQTRSWAIQNTTKLYAAAEKEFDLITAANTHQHCCTQDHSFHGVGPLGRPNSDLIIASALVLHAGGIECFQDDESVTTCCSEEAVGTSHDPQTEDIENEEDVRNDTTNFVAEPALPSNESSPESLIPMHDIPSARVTIGDLVNISYEETLSTDVFIDGEPFEVEPPKEHTNEDTSNEVSSENPGDTNPEVAVEDIQKDAAPLNREKKEKQLAALMAEMGWKIIMKGKDGEQEYMGLCRHKA